MTLSNIKHTFIGICLAILCVWSLVIIIFPILAMLFPALLDFLFSFILGETNYAAIGIATLLTLLILFIWWTYLLVTKTLKKQITSNYSLLGYYVIQLFLVAPLMYYFLIANNWEVMKDGQFIFGIILVFPFAGLVSLSTGIVLDVLRALKTR
jgi:hypothetical protein